MATCTPSNPLGVRPYPLLRGGNPLNLLTELAWDFVNLNLSLEGFFEKISIFLIFYHF
jgi:hypothetical protein